MSANNMNNPGATPVGHWWTSLQLGWPFTFLSFAKKKGSFTLPPTKLEHD